MEERNSAFGTFGMLKRRKESAGDAEDVARRVSKCSGGTQREATAAAAFREI